MKRYVILLLMLTTAFWSCSENENPVEQSCPSGKIVAGFVYSPNIDNNASEQVAGRSVYIYEPPEYMVSDIDSFELYIETREPYGADSINVDTTHIVYYVRDSEYPSLYLLHGFGGNADYFTDIYMLQDIMDEMIANGEIIPMIVITPDCSNSFGGSFYTNSESVYVDTLDEYLSFTGQYEDFIVNELMDYMTINYNIDTTAESRAISGHSMGGYGAMKIAMKHPELFGSVSSMSGPLAFPYFINTGVFDSVFARNDFNPSDPPTAEDSAAFYAIVASADDDLTSMMFAMGAAFSPHDRLSDDTTYFHRLREVDYYGIDLPFNASGEIGVESDTLVWPKWLSNDVYSMVAGANFDAAFGNLAIFFDCGDADQLGLAYQNQAFDQALSTAEIPHTYEEYSGYSGFNADHSAYIAERLRVILKFHSDQFVLAAAE
ncbi:MAG: hypothetical protein J7K40_14935 [candidate division Zixibacteria bacterium]|nr:hypothetical protein [candidate division Zixibacteria bacterium]